MSRDLVAAFSNLFIRLRVNPGDLLVIYDLTNGIPAIRVIGDTIVITLLMVLSTFILAMLMQRRRRRRASLVVATS